MDDHWDLDSVMELCCSKLSPEHELYSFEDGGNLDWLDQKVDLSAWAQLDFPDDLPPVMLEPSDPQVAPPFQPSLPSSCGAPKADNGGHWEGYTPYSPPPSTPPTPNAVVPNVDIFINFDSPGRHGTIDSSPASASRPQTPYYVLGVGSSDGEIVDPASYLTQCSSSAEIIECAGSPVVEEVVEEIVAVTEPSSQSNSRAASPFETPAESPISSCPTYLDDPVLTPPTSYCSVPSPEDVKPELPLSASPDSEDDDPMDADFVPEANGSDSESAPDAASPGPSSRGRKRTVRRRRKVDRSSRKERKRLQNKDAATRYRQKKKQEFSIIEQELEELKVTNVSLQSEAQRVSNEISYLKGLMRELFRAKGLIK